MLKFDINTHHYRVQARDQLTQFAIMVLLSDEKASKPNLVTNIGVRKLQYRSTANVRLAKHGLTTFGRDIFNCMAGPDHFTIIQAHGLTAT